MWSFQEPGSSRPLSLSLLSALAVDSLLTFGKETGSSSQGGLTGWKPAFPPHQHHFPAPNPTTRVRGCGAGRSLANPPCSGM